MSKQSKISIHRAHKSCGIPSNNAIKHWAGLALGTLSKETEISIRIVDQEESAVLNKKYRNKVGSTNILSFPMNIESPEHEIFLGDLVICAQTIANEAMQQKKKLDEHWAHIVIHGILHLLGYSHDESSNTKIMEDLEKKLLSEIDISNPYIAN
ncbi:MAG: rRNA maturation RNase YbeY [Porticoccaceae bacterium]|nr:rRNA maturation RNase YbeY [Porticoccaceae bacterium]|tara:strand:+ start:608 stop:1069 length:462 start_codon:yes stop_codon:yes gene_type:complete